MWRNLHPLKPLVNSDRSLRNVLILSSHNSSADYLGVQDANSMVAPDFDCWDGKAHRLAEEYLEGLRTRDGIQFFQFKHRALTGDATGSRSIAPCVDAMEGYINGRGEKLDAIVVRAGIGDQYENAQSISWLAEMKVRFPGVKVLVDGYYPHSKTLEEIETAVMPKPHYARDVKASRFAIATKAEALIENVIKRVVIAPGHSDYVLAGPVDLMAVNALPAERPNMLRGLIGMERLAERGR